MRLLLVLLALLISVPAMAQKADFVQIREGETVTLRPDRAYILYRTSPALESIKTQPSLLSEDSDGPNVITLNYDKPLVRGPEQVYLTEVKPGSYVLLGVNWKGSAGDTCYCFGTVRFEAGPGTITDMGYLFGDRLDRRSSVPELAATTGGREKISPDLLRVTGALRPYAEGMPVPMVLAGLHRVPAEFHAVGKFPNGYALAIDRLPPVPGVLAYDADRVIDVRTEGKP